uniref:Uncharacterized protein n=2 Tax=Anguilla anguilla TaxID=7936 RepID=A0A0E9P5Z5_ANGAN
MVSLCIPNGTNLSVIFPLIMCSIPVCRPPA